MKNISKRLLAVILFVSLVFGSSAISTSAADTVDGISRVSCTFNGDSKTSRGFCWYTAKDSKSDVQVVKAADFDGTFANAKTYSDDNAYKFRKQYCHKMVADGLEVGAEYKYRVGDASLDMWSDVGTFVTDDGDNSFSFITIADVQASSDENFAQAFETLKGAMKMSRVR